MTDDEHEAAISAAASLYRAGCTDAEIIETLGRVASTAGVLALARHRIKVEKASEDRSTPSKWQLIFPSPRQERAPPELLWRAWYVLCGYSLNPAYRIPRENAWQRLDPHFGTGNFRIEDPVPPLTKVSLIEPRIVSHHPYSPPGHTPYRRGYYLISDAMEIDADTPATALLSNYVSEQCWQALRELGDWAERFPDEMLDRLGGPELGDEVAA